MEVSNLFVCVMGMGVTFLGLTCIIFLTLLMGKVMSRFQAEEPKAAAPAPAAPAAPALPADGVSDEVRVAIIAALAQDPAFRLDRVTRIDIRKV